MKMIGDFNSVRRQLMRQLNTGDVAKLDVDNEAIRIACTTHKQEMTRQNRRSSRYSRAPTGFCTIAARISGSSSTTATIFSSFDIKVVPICLQSLGPSLRHGDRSGLRSGCDVFCELNRQQHRLDIGDNPSASCYYLPKFCPHMPA